MHRLKAVWTIGVFAAALSTWDFAHAEIVGSFDIAATPSSAVLLSGGGASWNWLNVLNAPVTLNDALTGFSVIDDGYANAQSGTLLRLTFTPGVRNEPGPDLVLLDAGNDLNQYRIRTSYDSFSNEILVNASTDTGVDRSYYYGGTGPATYRVYAGTIDLSNLNVPAGASVSQVQLFTEGPSNDPVGLGVLRTAAAAPAATPWGLGAMALALITLGAWALDAHRIRVTRDGGSRVDCPPHDSDAPATSSSWP
jgi:hypothetical protein